MTLREIAIESGVSPATVSFVLNNKPGVSQEIREKIAGKLVENGYTLRNRDEVRDASRGTILFADYEDSDFGQYMLKDEFFKDTLTSIQRVCEEENFKFLFKIGLDYMMNFFYKYMGITPIKVQLIVR